MRNAPEKVWVLDFARFMPPTMITRSLGAARKFLAEHGDIVLKPLHGNAGKAVFKVGRDGANLASLIELFNATYREPHVLQAFLPEVAEGDKRIVLVDGEVAGAINRRPGRGRDPLQPRRRRHGAKPPSSPRREQEICAALGPELKRRGLLFVGIDVIGGRWLTEINVTSPTGIVAIDKFNGTDTPALIWDAIERKVAQVAPFRRNSRSAMLREKFIQNGYLAFALPLRSSSAHVAAGGTPLPARRGTFGRALRCRRVSAQARGWAWR